MNRKGLSDENLPDWAHTACIMVIVSVFAAPLLWAGFEAMASGQLRPMRGPGFGMWMFGKESLQGPAARVGGGSLLGLGLTFLALGVSWTRWAEGRVLLRWLPWLLCAASLLLSFWAVSLGRA